MSGGGRTGCWGSPRTTYTTGLEALLLPTVIVRLVLLCLLGLLVALPPAVNARTWLLPLLTSPGSLLASGWPWLGSVAVGCVSRSASYFLNAEVPFWFWFGFVVVGVVGVIGILAEVVVVFVVVGGFVVVVVVDV